MNKEEYKEFVRELYKNQIVVFDTETTGLKPYSGDSLCGIAFYLPSNHQSYYVPIQHCNSWVVNPTEELNKWFSDNANVAVGHNTKFDMHFIERYGIKLGCKFEDTMLLAHLYNENEMNFKLKDLGVLYIDASAKDEESELNYEAAKLGILNAKGHMADLPADIVAPYAKQDVILTWKLYCYYMQRMDIRQPNREIISGVSKYLSVVQRMEKIGVLLDTDKCKDMVKVCEENAESLENKAYALAGRKFNLGSYQQVRAVLGVEKSDEDFLAKLDNPLAHCIVQCRKWRKAKGTYFESFLDKVDGNNIIHPSFHLAGTVTGRLSCREPNFQNIPRDSDLYKVKSVIIAPPGYSIVSFDYSQIELRLHAYYSQDRNLLSAYQDGTDVHTQTAQATGLSRQDAKTLNFAMCYGAGPSRIMELYNVSDAEARRILCSYQMHFPGIPILRKNSERYAETHGHIVLWTGRVRHFSSSSDYYKASNSLIQGGVGEIMRIAITNLDTKGYRMFNQIHDDIMTYVPDDELKESTEQIKRTMENFKFDINGDPTTEVPVKVEGKVGKSWGELKPI